MNKAVCIGCGCDDYHACEGAVFANVPCRWLYVDRQKGLGVCSSCPELAQRVGRLSGNLVVDPDYSAKRFAQIFKDVYDEREAQQWFERRQDLLNGKTPRELVAGGQIARLRQVVSQLLDGVYL